MSNDNPTPNIEHVPPTGEEVPFGDEKFAIIIGLNTTENDATVRMRMAYSDKALMEGGKHMDLSNPAVFMGWWLKEHWAGIMNMAASEYNVRQSLAMVTAGNESKLHLVTPDGSRLQ